MVELRGPFHELFFCAVSKRIENLTRSGKLVCFDSISMPEEQNNSEEWTDMKRALRSQ